MEIKMQNLKLVVILSIILFQNIGAWEIFLHERNTLVPHEAHFIDDTTFVLLCSNERKEVIPNNQWGHSYSIRRTFVYTITTSGRILSFEEHYISLGKSAKMPDGGFVLSGTRTTEEHKKDVSSKECVFRLNENGEILWKYKFDEEEEAYHIIEKIVIDSKGDIIVFSSVRNRNDGSFIIPIIKLDKNGKKLSECYLTGFPGETKWSVNYTVEYIEILSGGYRLFMTEWKDGHDCETAAWVVRTDFKGKVLFSNRIRETELPCSGKIGDNAYFCEAPWIIGTNSIIMDSLGNIYDDFWGKEIRSTYFSESSNNDFLILSAFTLVKGDIDSLHWKRDYSSFIDTSKFKLASGHSVIEKPGGGFILFAIGETLKDSYWGISQVLWIFPVDSLGNPEIERPTTKAENLNVYLVNRIILDGCSLVNVRDNYCYATARPIYHYMEANLSIKRKYSKNPLVSQDTRRLVIFEISNLQSIDTIGQIYPGTYMHIEDIVISDSIAYIITNSQGSYGKFAFFNLSNPDSIFKSYLFNTRRRFYGLSLYGQYAYTINSDRVFTVLHIPASDTAYVVGLDTTIGLLANKIVSDNSFAYIAAWEEGLRIYDVHNPTDPYETGKLNTPGSSVDIFIDENIAYIADGYAGLRIINISNPYNPEDAGFYQTDEYFNSVCVESCFAYVTVADFGLRIIDISDPAMPFEVGYYATKGRPLDVAVQDMTIFVADYDRGLIILDSSPIRGLIIDIKQDDTNGTYSICAPLEANIEIIDAKGNLIESGISRKSSDPLLRSSFYGKFVWTPAPSIPSGVYLVRVRFDPSTGSGHRRLTDRSTESVTKRIVYLK